LKRPFLAELLHSFYYRRATVPPVVFLFMLSAGPQPENETTIRRHPDTSVQVLAPYVAYDIEVEWFDHRGWGPYRALLEGVTKTRPYVEGRHHSLNTFEGLLPVLHPFSAVVTIKVGLQSLAAAVARLLIGAGPADEYNCRVEPQTDGAVVHVSTKKPGPDSEPKPYCKVLMLDGVFQIQGPRGEDWGLQNVLAAYELLRKRHVAVGLTPDQFAVL
jgi:hypothetical protein